MWSGLRAEAIYNAGREAVVEVFLRMAAQIQALTARVARQDERIAQLERRLNRSSRNSSTPPSADRPVGTRPRLLALRTSSEAPRGDPSL